jgi:hypothetical protein
MIRQALDDGRFHEFPVAEWNYNQNEVDLGNLLAIFNYHEAEIVSLFSRRVPIF